MKWFRYIKKKGRKKMFVYLNIVSVKLDPHVNKDKMFIKWGGTKERS